MTRTRTRTRTRTAAGAAAITLLVPASAGAVEPRNPGLNTQAAEETTYGTGGAYWSAGRGRGGVFVVEADPDSGYAAAWWVDTHPAGERCETEREIGALRVGPAPAQCRRGMSGKLTWRIIRGAPRG